MAYAMNNYDNEALRRRRPQSTGDLLELSGNEKEALLDLQNIENAKKADHEER